MYGGVAARTALAERRRLQDNDRLSGRVFPASQAISV